MAAVHLGIPANTIKQWLSRGDDQPFAPVPGATPESSANGEPWRRTIDTALLTPLDIVGLDEGPMIPVETTYHVSPHSMIVLIAEG